MKKRSALDWLVFGVVVAIALIVITLSFRNTAILARELNLNPYLTAGLVEVLFASLLFIRGRQRATQLNVPFFLELGYFVSLTFVTSVNMYGLSKESEVIGSIVGLTISGAMWLMESVLVWLWVDSHKPHHKSLREIQREAKAEIEEEKVIQRIQWLKWNAQKPDLRLIKEARKADEKRSRVVGDGLPEYFVLIEQEEKPPQIVAEPVREMAEIVPLKRPIGFYTPTNTEQTETLTNEGVEQPNTINRTPSTEQKEQKEQTKTERATEYVLQLIEKGEQFSTTTVARDTGVSRATAHSAIQKAKAHQTAANQAESNEPIKRV